jgi:hypothetical protein
VPHHVRVDDVTLDRPGGRDSCRRAAL